MAGSWPIEFHSAVTPSLESSQAMFVRLDGMNQRVVNALMGNKSQIIGHLPRFDSGQDTGRLYFEPKNLIWIDLDNPGEMTVSAYLSEVQQKKLDIKLNRLNVYSLFLIL